MLLKRALKKSHPTRLSRTNGLSKWHSWWLHFCYFLKLPIFHMNPPSRSLEMCNKNNKQSALYKHQVDFISHEIYKCMLYRRLCLMLNKVSFVSCKSKQAASERACVSVGTTHHQKNNQEEAWQINLPIILFFLTKYKKYIILLFSSVCMYLQRKFLKSYLDY
jgi:hypothetical protein